MSLVVPGIFEIKALSKPRSLLKVDDFPEFTGPTKTTLFLTDIFFLFLQPPKNKLKITHQKIKIRNDLFIHKISPSSEKSISPSTRTLKSFIAEAKHELF